MKYVLTILMAVGLSVAASSYTATHLASADGKATVTASGGNTLFAKLQRTKTLRCAYISWSKSYFSKDPNTGQFEGIGYDLAEATAKVLGIKINWVEEVGLGTMYEGLRTGRYDAICTPIWTDATVTANALPSAPAGLSPVYAYARADNAKFLADDPDALAKINHKEVTLIDVDGANGIETHRNRYPNATLISMPATMSGAELIQQVALKKADITQQNPAMVEDFIKENPGVLKRVTAQPLMAYPNAPFVFPMGEYDTKIWFDSAITTMKNIGAIDTIMKRFDPEHKFFLKAD